MKRLRSVLLTLWDLAREHPGYDRKLWGELQFLLNDLETRNKILCSLMTEMLQSAESMDESLIHSPPEGYAVTFLREELARDASPEVHDAPSSFNAVDMLMNISPPQTDEERYDGGDESLEDSSYELIFDFGTTD